jgi:hypothetical protein
VGTPWVAQLVPPSVVATTPAPVATQFDEEPHETAMTPMPLEMVCLVQVAPPSDEEITPEPTARQSEADAHEMPSS